MTTVTAMTTTRPSGQPGYVPKLRYRNPAPADVAVSADDAKDAPIAVRIPATSSIREIRESLPRSPSTMSSYPLVSQPIQQKKKASLFGGLFVKEPSMAALDMVSAQMMDKHGKISPATMPHVSSAKMPQHVPKVNSKWDGVPESVKAKECETKERQKAAMRTSLLPNTNNTSRSTSEPAERLRGRRLSNANSWDSRSTGSRPTFQDNPPRPDSIYSSDSGNSSQPSQGQGSAKSQSYRSPSGTSLPEITAFFPNEIPVTPKTPQRCISSTSSNTQITGYSDRTGLGRPTSNVSTIPTEPIPEYTTSQPTTPLDDSPRTPFPLSDDENMDIAMKRRGVVAPAKLTIPSSPSKTKRISIQPIDAFLAGEAKPLEIPNDECDYSTVSELPFREKSPTSRQLQAGPIGIVQQDLEKRPDSSRARLGLRASMVVPADGAPWESGEAEVMAPQSPRSPTSPRSKFRLFGKEKP